MIIVLKPEASESEVDHIIDRLRDLGLKSQISTGQERTIIGPAPLQPVHGQVRAHGVIVAKESTTVRGM